VHALFQLGDAGGRVHAGALRQHGHGHEVLGEQRGDAVAQLVADGGPAAGHIEVANVVGHEARARAEQRDVAAALLHQPELVGLDGLAQFVVADVQVCHFGHGRWILDAGDLRIAPVLQRLGGRGVVAVAVDDEAHGLVLLEGVLVIGQAGSMPCLRLASAAAGEAR